MYLHWIIPRIYRTGTAATGFDSFGAPKDPQGELDRRVAAGFPTPSADQAPTIDQQSIVFRNTPNRWLVIRRLHAGTVLPIAARSRVQPFHAFLVESDRLQNIQNLDDSVDLQVDVTPFINGYDQNLNNPDGLAGQAEIFIGQTFQDVFNVPLPGGGVGKWTEQDVTRVPVSVLNSSNHLFPDYIPHNGSVFSMVDGFTYLPDDNPGTKLAKLDSATASYQVIGWHSDKNIADDPFFIDPKLQNPPTRQARMASNKMYLSAKVQDNHVNSWLTNNTSTRTLCHGTMYQVEYSLTDPPKNIPADSLGNLLKQAYPIAIGTTPLDSIMSYVGAHIDTSSTSGGTAQSNPSPEQIVYKDLKALQTLLLKQEETTDSQYEANDMLSSQSYVPTKDSGYSWQLSGQNSEGQPTQPTPDQLTQLTALNMVQEALDIASRDLRLEQWNLWSMWWKYYSQRPTKKITPPPVYQDHIDQSALVVNLGNKVTDLQNQVTQQATALKVSTIMTNLPLRFKLCQLAYATSTGL